jgi:hypothetical protein
MTSHPEIVPSVVDRIKRTLVGLKMPCAIEILDATVRQLERGEMSALEAIDALLTEELTLRENRRIKTALVMARLSTIKTLASFDFSFQPSLDKNRRQQLGPALRFYTGNVFYRRAQRAGAPRIDLDGIRPARFRKPTRRALPRLWPSTRRPGGQRNRRRSLRRSSRRPSSRRPQRRSYRHHSRIRSLRNGWPASLICVRPRSVKAAMA